MTTKTAATALTYTSEFGTLHVGRFDGRWRRDQWVSNDGTVHAGYPESAFATGSADKSDRQKQYDARCSSCWLGATHTQEYHAKSLAGAAAVPDPLAFITYSPRRLPGLEDVARDEQGLLWADVGGR